MSSEEKESLAKDIEATMNQDEISKDALATLQERFTAFINRSSPRKEAEKITEGEEDEKHLGKKTGAMLQQEFFSLINETDANRKDDLEERWHELKEEILDLPDGDSIWTSFCSKYGHLGRIIA